MRQRRRRLHHDRQPQPLGGVDRLVRGPGQLGAARRDPDRGQQLGRVPGIEPPPAGMVGERPHGDLPGRADVHRGRSGDGPGRPPPPGPVRGDVADGAHRRLREGVRRQRGRHVRGVGQHAAGVGAEQHGGDGRPGAGRAGRVPDRDGHRGRIGHRGRRVDDHDGVHLARVDQRPQGALVLGRPGRGAEVDRVAGRSKARGAALRSSSWVAAESSGTSSPAVGGRVGGEDAGTAGVADDAEPAAGRQRLVGQQPRDVEQLAEVVAPGSPRPAAERGDRDVRRRRGRRVRGAGPGPAADAAALHARRPACAGDAAGRCRANFRGLPNDSR